MSFYADLKIKYKLILGFATVVFMALAIGIFSYFQIEKIQRADTLLFEQGVLPSVAIGDIATDFQRLRVNLRELTLASSPQKHTFYFERVTTFREDLDARIENLEKTLPDADSRNRHRLLVAAHKSFAPIITKTLELARADRDREALEYLQSVGVYTVEHAEIAAIENLQNYLVVNSEMLAEQNSATALATGRIMLLLAFGAALLATLMTVLITRSVADPLNQVSAAVIAQLQHIEDKSRLIDAVASGDLEQELHHAAPLMIQTDALPHDEAGMVLRTVAEMSAVQSIVDESFSQMTKTLRQNRDNEMARSWLKNGANELNKLLRGDRPTAEMLADCLAFICQHLDAGTGVFYLYDDKEAVLKIAVSYACTRSEGLKERIGLGEGLAGQAALQRQLICLNEAPPDYLPISSGLGKADPVNILALPLLYNNILTGILELGSFKEFRASDLEFLQQANEGIAIAISVNTSRQLVNELLEQTQGQAEELRVQQEELQQTNEELTERAQMLELQREQIQAQNRKVAAASRELQVKADELTRVSAYKSEFLANMSHELRTPLNSLMILSSLLKDNREGNLTEKQVEFAATINGAGRDLLNLINDILDISKIESGHIEFHYEEIQVAELCGQLGTTFKTIAADKGIDFAMAIENDAPEAIITDEQRTQQILKNLLSNACKFTNTGGVSLRVYPPPVTENPLATKAVAFAVTDSGIGIPADKHELVFNAFQQADGSTSRTYGGTGLGLSISRQLARFMGGEIGLVSEPGVGSTFTLYLPLKAAEQAETAPTSRTSQSSQSSQTSQTSQTAISPPPIPDDRAQFEAGAKSILVIEDDQTFAAVLADMVRGRGFFALVAADGESGIALAERYQPSAVILDVMLPHIDGWGVMRSLKDNPATRHIPVHFITCLEERQKAMSMGAIGYVTKPVNREQLDSVFGTLESAIEKTMKMLLIVEDDQAQATAMVALLQERNVTITVADSGAKAIQLLANEQFDCIVLDLGLADMGAFELLEELKRLDPQRRIPVIIHTGRQLSHDDEKRLRHYAESIIIKGAKSPERLLNEVTLFLHLVESSLDPGKQQMIRTALDKEAMLAGKKILIVDDDMRNIFSLSSALAEKEMIIFEAENGREALRQLDANPDMDLVLMDIMMPEMDGYEAMRSIRKDPRFQSLPIITLTAKAMKGDREECLKSGASDYIPKPVDMDKLFSLLRVWLYQEAVPERIELS